MSEIINEIDSELKPEWQPGAFKWADETQGDIHIKAIDRFEKALLKFNETFNAIELQHEAEIYKRDIIKILKAYKEYKKLDEQISFLESLKTEN